MGNGNTQRQRQRPQQQQQQQPLQLQQLATIAADAYGMQSTAIHM